MTGSGRDADSPRVEGLRGEGPDRQLHHQRARGLAEHPATIPGNDGIQSFVLTFNGTQAFDVTAMQITFDCTGVSPAVVVVGVDTSDLCMFSSYLAEAVHPENRIVVHYDQAALVLLAGYDEAGIELSYEEVHDTAARLGWPVAARRHYGSFGQMIAETRALPKTAEGVVVRFVDGTRLKVKGDEYRRIHALISRCTPLAMWEAMVAGDELQAIRRDLPEEFWEDFDSITRLLDAQYASLVERVAVSASSVAHLSDKELGLQLSSMPPETAPYVFGFRKAGNRLDGRGREKALRQLRPTDNELPGYVPSYAMGRMRDESL